MASKVQQLAISFEADNQFEVFKSIDVKDGTLPTERLAEKNIYSVREELLHTWLLSKIALYF